MIAKKEERVNLEKKRGLFLLLGFLGPGALLLAAFTYHKPVFNLEDNVKHISSFVSVYEEIPLIEKQEEVVEVLKHDQQEEKQQTIDVMNDVNENITSSANKNQVTDPNKTAQKNVDIKFGDDEFKVSKVKVISDVEPFPDVDAAYFGGLAERQKFISEHFKISDMDIEEGNEGVIYVSFVVETDGSISDVKIARGVSASLDREAERVTKLFPKWKPGEKSGHRVRTRVNMPIVIALD